MFDSGLDKRHSAIHIDGGLGVVVNFGISQSTGNGLMLDSEFSALEGVVCKGTVTSCMRGVSFSGAHKHQLRQANLCVEAIANRECGVLVSNSSQAQILDSRITANGKYGILFQGKNGGRDCMVANCEVSGHERDICEIHASGNNTIVDSTAWGIRPMRLSVMDTSDENKKAAKEVAPISESNRSSFCIVCGSHSTFVFADRALREDFRCNVCKASLRYRVQSQALLSALTYVAGNAVKDCDSLESSIQQGLFKEFDIYEPGIVGPYEKRFSLVASYQRSYYWDDFPLGESKDGVRNENLEALTFDDESFDLVITSDIFEHVRNPLRAFEEVARILKPGGCHVFTIPAQLPMRQKTVFRVDTSTEEDVHILPAHYHIAGDGGKSLVYTEFGVDFWKKVQTVAGTAIETIVYQPKDGEDVRSCTAIAFIQRKGRTSEQSPGSH